MNEKVDVKITTDGDNLVDDIMSIAGIHKEPATEEQKQAIWDEFIRELLSDNEPVYDDTEKEKYSLSPRGGMYTEQKQAKDQRCSEKIGVAYKLMETNGWDLKIGNVYDTSLAHVRLIDEKTGKRFLMPSKVLQNLISKSCKGYVRSVGDCDAFYICIEVDKKFLIETI